MAFASSVIQPEKHGVFLSFRGADTRNNFISHLFAALCQRGIPTFIDSEGFERGKEISAILNEIEGSRASVIVFSRNYASSLWCLDEVVKIMECMKRQEQLVLPVFYHVDPKDVRHQTGSFREAFAKHEEDFKENIAKVQSWKTALKEASSLSGWVLHNDRSESMLTKEIVEYILKKLSLRYSNDFHNLVGIYTRIQQIETLLCIGQEDVRTIGIWGMGGVGKTTLASVVFEKYRSHFEGSYFLINVREEWDRRGVRQLREELLFKLSNGSNFDSYAITKQLRHKKVLIVLDDVDIYRQYEGLVGNCDGFDAGSRIIITSRDKQVLNAIVGPDYIYQVSALNKLEAFELFKLFVFRENCAKTSHLELTSKVVNYAQGNPLALKVLGLFLRDKSIREWESALLKLRRNPNLEIQGVLKLSYDGLDSHDQQIFLDIACFFKGMPISSVERILNAYGFSTTIGLRNLIDRSLIIISHSTVDMHGLLQEMGQEIVRQECFKEPGARSRLWNHDDICHVLTKNAGTEKVEGMSLDMSKVSELCLSPMAFASMNQLKLLKFYGHGTEPLLHLPRGLAFLPNELRYLQWDWFPLECLPSQFVAENLVELRMPFSQVERLWAGVQRLPNLNLIDLQESKHLTEMPDLSMAPKLEILNFFGCASLLEVSPSVEHLTNLVELKLGCCSKIRNVPSTEQLGNIKRLDLCYCSSLNKFPEVSRNISELYLCGTAIGDVSSSIGSLYGLETLNLSNCTRLYSFPNNLGCLSTLHSISLEGSNLENIPASIKQLPWLEFLFIRHCRRLRSLPELPACLTYLDAEGCTSLQTVSRSSFALREGWVRHQECGPVFSFTNCCQLDENSRSNIFNHAHQSILSVARASKDAEIVTHGCFYVPGSEIPHWIEDQCRGSSITIQLPPDWYQSNFLGLALCAVFDCNDDGVDNTTTWSVYFKSSNGVGNGHCGNVGYPFCTSQHVFLWYSNRFHFTDCSKYNEVSFEIVGHHSSASLKVKKTGICLLYSGGEDCRQEGKRNACNEENGTKHGRKKRRKPLHLTKLECIQTQIFEANRKDEW